MKKSNLIVCLLLFAFASCKKESSKLTPEAPDAAKLQKISNVPGGGGSGGSYVYQDESGNFYTHFGRGFGYGSFFPYPTTVNSGDNGQPWNPGANGSVDYMSTNLNEYHEYDGYFTVSFLISPGFGASATAIASYYQAFDDFISGAKDANGDYKQFSLPSPGTYGLSNYLEVFTGHYVIDENSPTHVSITAITSAPGRVNAE